MKRCAPLLLLLTVLAFPVEAGAFKLDRRIIPQPRIQYYVALPDWRKPVDRAVRALNRAKVGVRLVKADIPQQASVQFGRLDRACAIPGITATTLALVGGYAVVYVPRDCKAKQAIIIAAHELGHALGLKHEDRGCALMNSSGTGPQSIPTGCLGSSFNWRRSPWRADDLAGLRRLYRNTAPKVTLRLTGPTTVPAGTSVQFRATAKDKQRNLSEVHIDYGDGTRTELLAGDPLPTSHLYSEPGTYTIRVTALDYYLKRSSKNVRVTVT